MKKILKIIYSILIRNLNRNNFAFLFFCLKKNKIKKVKNKNMISSNLKID